MGGIYDVIPELRPAMYGVSVEDWNREVMNPASTEAWAQFIRLSEMAQRALGK